MRLLIFAGMLFALAAVFVAVNYVTAPRLDQYAVRVGAPSIDCGKEGGMVAGPFVKDAATARRIFEAVAESQRDAEFMAKYRIHVDEGASDWAVYQSLPPAPDSCEISTSASARCSVTSGGGGLSMRIDKCTGAVSRVHYQR